MTRRAQGVMNGWLLVFLFEMCCRNFLKMFDAGKTRIIGLSYGEKNYDDMLSRFHPIPERYGRTDGRQICYINIARQYADAR